MENLVRAHLIQQMERHLATGHLAVLAPAGYGKTVLLQQLAAHRPDTYVVTLSPADADVTVMRGRLQELLQPPATLLLDDVHVLSGRRKPASGCKPSWSRRSCAWSWQAGKCPSMPMRCWWPAGWPN